MKKLIAVFTAVVLMLSVFPSSVYAAQEPVVHVAVDNEVVLFPDEKGSIDK